MKTIISIWGSAKQGKSTTVRLICKGLLAQYPNATIINLTKLVIDYSKGDLKVIVSLNDKKIGIESQGDPDSRLLESLEYFKEKNCDIIICSTRSYGSTFEAARNLHDYENIRATNYRTDKEDKETQKRLNEFSANQIIELVKKHV